MDLKSDWLTYWGVRFFEQLQEVMVGDTVGVVRVQLQHQLFELLVV